MTATPPLLQLAAGRKVRARRAPILRPRESKLHAAVAKLLTDHCLDGWEWTHINRKAKDAREGAILKIMGANPDWPDFILVSPYGSVRYLETKRLGETLTEGQEAFRMRAVARGIPHVVAWTMDQVLAALDSWGCLRIRINAARPEVVVVDGDME